MKLHIQEIETAKGRMVQMPLEEWQKYRQEFEKMKMRLYWKKRLKSSFDQVRKMEARELDIKTANDFRF